MGPWEKKLTFPGPPWVVDPRASGCDNRVLFLPPRARLLSIVPPRADRRGSPQDARQFSRRRSTERLAVRARSRYISRFVYAPRVSMCQAMPPRAGRCLAGRPCDSWLCTSSVDKIFRGVNLFDSLRVVGKMTENEFCYLNFNVQIFVTSIRTFYLEHILSDFLYFIMHFNFM